MRAGEAPGALAYTEGPRSGRQYIRRMQATTRPNRQAQRSQAAREHIVQAALGVFALKGYAAASMDDVCLAAGCSKGGLYHHFATKTAVLSGVIERLARTGALMPPFDGAAAATGMAPAALGRVLIEIWSECARNEDLRARLRAGYEARLEAGLSAGAHGLALAEILRIGTLVQLLSRSGEIDADEAARKLGISRAA